ncbi:hypothetical protein [Nibricoccus sp. IMCC34717]|uniref:hypothetical protein n=1 Tax=Nibricoccus sp. IMCC34717 TaxID=3034021 RepID=UPI00384B524C
MKRFYLFIIPIVGLIIFSVFYVQHLDVVEQKEKDKKAAEAKVAAEEAAKKAEAQKKAQEDAARRQKERDAEEAKKAAEKEQKHKDAIAAVENQIKEYRDEYNKYLNLTKENEQKLARLRDEREALRRENYDLTKQVSLAQIERRNAELEIQRFAAMVTAKAEQSLMPKPVAAPAK